MKLALAATWFRRGAIQPASPRNSVLRVFFAILWDPCSPLPRNHRVGAERRKKAAGIKLDWAETKGAQKSRKKTTLWIFNLIGWRDLFFDYAAARRN